jgi:hypothetical protein
MYIYMCVCVCVCVCGLVGVGLGVGVSVGVGGKYFIYMPHTHTHICMSVYVCVCVCVCLRVCINVCELQTFYLNFSLGIHIYNFNCTFVMKNPIEMSERREFQFVCLWPPFQIISHFLCLFCNLKATAIGRKTR